VTISESIVINDQTAVWAENRTPHEYLIPQGQMLGWTSEKGEMEDWIMGENSETSRSQEGSYESG